MDASVTVHLLTEHQHKKLLTVKITVIMLYHISGGKKVRRKASERRSECEKGVKNKFNLKARVIYK